jgi:hypothetical protein
MSAFRLSCSCLTACFLLKQNSSGDLPCHSTRSGTSPHTWEVEAWPADGEEQPPSSGQHGLQQQGACRGDSSAHWALEPKPASAEVLSVVL